MDRDWARLPAHILDSVLDRLELVSNYLRFSVVCKPWYCVAVENKTQQAKLELCAGHPMLLISADVEDTWDVYNVMDNKVLNLQLNFPNKRFCGSSKGWLITVEENFAVTLVNPFMRIKGERKKENSIIRLPQLTTPSGRSTTFWSERCSRYVIKAAISADPIVEADKCIVMVIEAEIYSMAFFRLGKDTTWTYIANTIGMCDVIFVDHKNLGPNFFFIEYVGLLYSSRGASSTDLECFLSEVDDDTVPHTLRRYLVDTNGGDPLLIERIVKYDYEEEVTQYVRTTMEFKVFEVDHCECRWNKRDTLGDDIAIFLGDNTAISVTASKFSGCEPNSIYFVHDLDALPEDKFELPLGPGDYGVYNLETKSFSQGPYSTVVQTLLKNTKLCPFWVEGLTPLQFILI